MEFKGFSTLPTIQKSQTASEIEKTFHSSGRKIPEKRSKELEIPKFVSGVDAKGKSVPVFLSGRHQHVQEDNGKRLVKSEGEKDVAILDFKAYFENEEGNPQKPKALSSIISKDLTTS